MAGDYSDRSDNFVAEEMIGEFEPPNFLEPEQAQGGEDLSLVRNSIGHDDVECADPIGGHNQQRLAEVIDVANLSASNRERKIGSQQS